MTTGLQDDVRRSTRTRRRPAPLRGGATLLIAAVLLLPTMAYGAGVTPIPNAGSTDLPTYVGAPAKAHPLPSAGVPQNPYLAPNPNNVHKDSWMSDTQPIAGPLGRAPVIWSTALSEARSAPSLFDICGPGSFDRHGRLETACSSPIESRLLLLDPDSLAVLASAPLPKATGSSSALSSAYMYLDNLDRAVVPGPGATILVIPQTGTDASPGFGPAETYDVSAALGGASTVFSPVPDWAGRIWFTGRESGIVGVLDPATKAVKTVRLGENEGIFNSFAVNRTAAYIVTDRALYRVQAGADGVPRIVWSATYENIGTTKPGQISDGSGTTPTVLGNGKYVAIVDNANQAHVMVYRTDVRLGAHQKRVVCEVPVFPPGQGAVEDSLTGLRRSIIAVNNYGYTIDFQTLASTRSLPGVARVDIDANGKGCRLVWSNDTVTSPNAGQVVSTKTGLVYLYTRKYDAAGLDVWYWTAVDFRTGATVWERQVGTGSQFDAYWPIPLLGPKGTAYMSAYGGITAIRDTP